MKNLKKKNCNRASPPRNTLRKILGVVIAIHNSEQCFTGSSLGTSSSDLNLLYKFGCIGREEVEKGKMHGSSLEITTW